MTLSLYTFLYTVYANCWMLMHVPVNKSRSPALPGLKNKRKHRVKKHSKAEMYLACSVPEAG